jgi:Caspase domain
MLNSTLGNILRDSLVVTVLLSSTLCLGATTWTVPPAYETAKANQTPKPFSIIDASNVEHVFYNESNAILILEGDYVTGGWAKVKEEADANEALLRESLETRGFHVFVWRNLNATQLRTVLAEAFPALGGKLDSRLFFYYFGHGKLLEADDTSLSQTFLVPLDAPDPLTDEDGFFRKSLPISQIVEYAKEIRSKHAFFALEACRAGAVIASLSGGLEPPNPQGYLLSPSIQRPIKYFLTAGSADADIAAKNAFTPLLVGALTNADTNGDGYVTGSEVINFVSERLPQFAPMQHPEHGSWPYSGGGDIVFGPAAPTQPPPKIASPATKTRIVTKEWTRPGLNVGCDQTQAGRVEATVDLDPRYEERVISITASMRDESNIKDQIIPVVEGPPAQRVIVRYSFNGLNAGLLGCPGGGHATLVVTFTIERKEPAS